MAEMPDLAALPAEVRIPRLDLALDFDKNTSLPSCLLCFVCLSGSSDLYASPSHPAVLCAVLCDSSTLSARQVLAGVVAKLPPSEAIQLQRASK